MKKFKKLLLFLLVIPICFSFSACKNKKGKNNGGVDDDDNNSPPVSPTQVYSVHFDYNLPEDYEYLLEDKTINDKLLGSNTALLSIPNSKLRPWFLGWSYKGESDILASNSTVSSAVSTTLELVGNWDEENLRKYFYTSNLEFDIDETNKEATVSACTMSGVTIIIPEAYVAGNIEIENDEVINEAYKVVGIDDNVFLGKNIGKVVLNAKDISIGSGAFKNSSISSLNFENVAEVGDNAFEGTNIQSVKFGSNLTSVGVSAFKDCVSLQSVDFSSASAEISQSAFYGDGNLAEIKNADGLTKIGNYAFYGCSSISSVDFLGGALTELGNGVFINCVGIVSAKIPKTVTTIGTNLFSGCNKLQTLTISRLYTKSNVLDGHKFTTIFGDISSSLKTITLKDNYIDKLTNNYFYGLENLSTLNMCDSIEIIEQSTFYNCSNLKNITLSNNLDIEQFSISVFKGTKFLEELTSPLIYKKSLLYVPENISENYNFTDDNGDAVDVEKICEDAFKGNKNLKSISFPSTVTFIGDGAFEECENLETVTFAENSNITELKSNLFKKCKKLTSVNIENLTALTTISGGVFYSTALTIVKIPSTVTSIASDAFVYSQNITKFEILGSSTKFEVIADVLYEKLADNKLKLICYPASKVGNLFVCPENVTLIGSRAFVSANNLDAVIFKASVSCDFELIGNENYEVHAFDNATGIVILSENTSIYCNSRSVLTYYFTGNATFSASNSTVTLESNFSLVNGKTNYYTQYSDTESGKVYYICFKVSESGGVKTATLVKQIETNLAG